MGNRNTTPVIEIGGKRRNSYDFGDPRLREHSSPSTHSLPLAGTFARSKIPQPNRAAIKRHNPSKASSPDFKTIEYESDFESDDEESKSVPNSTLSGMDIKKMKEDTLRNIQMRMEAARAENEMASLSMSQRFSKGGKKMILRPDSQEERRERANRRETRYAKELRARKFRELQFEMQQNLPPPNLGTRTPNSVNLHPNDDVKTRQDKQYLKPSPRHHSQNSLDPGNNKRDRSPNPSPRPNLRPSPKPSLRPSPRTSPVRSRRQSPVRSRRQSPIKSRRQSPVSRKSSPVRKSQTKSPARGRKLSPTRIRKEPRKLSPDLLKNMKDRPSRIPKSRSHDRSLAKEVEKPARRHNSLGRTRTEFGTMGTMRLGMNSQSSTRTGLGSSMSRTSALALSLENKQEIEEIVANLETARVRQTKPMSTTFSRGLTQPYAKPQTAMQEVKGNLASEDWEEQVEGIQGVCRMALFHTDLLKGSLQEVTLALLRHGKNLRSQVSRWAMQALMHLFDSLQRSLEPNLEKIVNLLLNKAVETNKFLKEDANNALDSIVENTLPSKAVPILIQEGINHKNALVKATLARLLAYYAERLTPAKIIGKDLGEKLVPAAAKLAQEGSLDTRKWAKIFFQRLAVHPGFADYLRRCIDSTDLTHLKKFFDNLFSETRIAAHDSARSKSNVGSRYSRGLK